MLIFVGLALIAKLSSDTKGLSDRSFRSIYLRQYIIAIGAILCGFIAILKSVI